MKLKKKYEKDLLKIQKFKLKNFYVFRQSSSKVCFLWKNFNPEQRLLTKEI